MKNTIAPELLQEFKTFFELSGMVDSPDYDKSIAYFKLLEKHSNTVSLKTIGYSAQGRPIHCCVVGGKREFTPKQARRSGKAVVLIQNGIHPGEIEGKDATMLLLREILITGEKKHLLENLILLIIPVLNVDGHERTGPFNRPNQNGPLSMGWRVNANNLNLNRDYLKADSPEMKSMLRLFSQWLPDLIIDNHTTNGADYQYHITYGVETKQIMDKGLAKYAQTTLIPHFCKDLEQAGFLSAPYFELRGHKPEEGFIEMVNLPRFSTGYSAVQNRLCVLVETHSLKPFKNRVYSTKKMNESILELCHTDFETIKLLNEKADKKTLSDYHHGGKPFPLRFVHTELEENLQFKGYKSEEINSAITGSAVVRYTKVPVEFSVPYFRTCEISETVKLPEYYIIPPEFSEIIRVLKLHGIKTQVIAKAIELPVQQYVFSKITFARAPYEGRFRVSYSLTEISMQKLITEGFVLVPLKQRGLKVIAHLLEPNSEDSFAAWGFFNAFFERKEYAEEYVFEPIAQKMYADDETLREKFNQALQNDEKFVNDPGSRLDFFYRNSGYFDEREKKYPIFRCFTKGKLH